MMVCHLLCFTVPPTSLSIENVTPQNSLLGTEGQDLTVSCKAVGGKPAPNVVLIIDGQIVASRIQSVQHTFNTISRSYDRKTVTCQVIVERKIEATNAAMTIINAHPYVISPKHFWNYLQFRYITAVSVNKLCE
jgi:hypothetical protein